jgi:hypothetical protein
MDGTGSPDVMKNEMSSKGCRDSSIGHIASARQLLVQSTTHISYTI